MTHDSDESEVLTTNGESKPAERKQHRKVNEYSSYTAVYERKRLQCI